MTENAGSSVQRCDEAGGTQRKDIHNVFSSEERRLQNNSHGGGDPASVQIRIRQYVLICTGTRENECLSLNSGFWRWLLKNIYFLQRGRERD